MKMEDNMLMSFKNSETKLDMNMMALSHLMLLTLPKNSMALTKLTTFPSKMTEVLDQLVLTLKE